ncbi:MAG TPA: erythromycin esterase family protein [Rickettsiales bacterium]|nr:erythromycin esterase family protein [Rickettsiales bacterium]
MNEDRIAAELDRYATRLTGGTDDYDEIISMAKNARFVLIGEESHGTHEFYNIRAAITQRLITELGFTAVAVEADWPDAYRINRYVRGDTTIDNAEDALSDFKRFPQWMWCNTEVRNFINWLYDYNHLTNSDVPQVGFYGLDLYSLNNSTEAVIRYLEKIDPEAAKRAKNRYGCFDAYGNDPQVYGYATALGVDENCERKIIEQLRELQENTFKYMQRDGALAGEEFFSAEQNARVVADAENYYRALFKGRPSSWNIRDTHMADTLDKLAEYLTKRHGKPAKIVVWAHNSHIGDASATDAGKRGETNIGQLTRERHAAETLLIGFSTYNGTVTASSDWDEPEEHKRVRNALPGSVEELFHRVEVDNFLLDLRANTEVRKLLSEPRLQRFIGVIYRPDTERWSHYYNVTLPREFDCIIHLDHTKALHPLTPGHLWKNVPYAAEETYPTGL